MQRATEKGSSREAGFRQIMFSETQRHGKERAIDWPHPPPFQPPRLSVLGGGLLFVPETTCGRGVRGGLQESGGEEVV
jgi:hypothetical protein